MASISLWPIDPLVQVFQDDTPPARKPRPLEVLAARNEYESAQFALRADVPLTNISARVAGLRGARVEFVGHVPIKMNTHETEPDEFVRMAPDMFPDPLFPDPVERLAPDTTLPLWATLRIPKAKKPGTYDLRIIVECDQGTFEEPFSLRVMSATVPDKRNLWVTNGFSLIGPLFQKFHKVELFTKKFWNIVEHYAKMMREYRNNVVHTNFDWLVEYKAGKNGKLLIDFSNFDRWVRLFQKTGTIGRIEGSGFASRNPWKAPEFDIDIKVVEKGKVVNKKGRMGDPEVEAFLEQFFGTLQKHLKKRGWLKDYMQHVAGEAVIENVASARRYAERLYKYAPEIRHTEALHCKEMMEGVIDVWVPQVNNFDEDYEFYRKRKEMGDELWFYTCCFPGGTFPNRFIDCALIKVRLLHWLNFRFGATGYLHWGLNQWRTDDPYTEMHSRLSPGITLPPGDAWIVYPSDEHILLSSIRYEAMRDGIEDYELLIQLEKKDPKKAHALARRMIPKMTQPQKDVAKFRRTRRELLEALEG